MRLAIFCFCLWLPIMCHAQPCATILKQSAHHYVNSQGMSNLAMQQAIHEYGQCYQQKTKAIDKALGADGRGPLMGVRGNFQDFQQALTQFENYALQTTATGGSYDALQAAWIKLYSLKFAREFFESYVQPTKPTINKKQLYALQNRFHQRLSMFGKDEQTQLETYFDAMNNAWVQGVNGSPMLPYQFAMLILQSPASTTFEQPML